MGAYSVSRSVTIDAAPERILPLLTSFPEWPRWSPWEGLDPELHREYRGAESGAGAVYEWSGNAKAGAGIMSITEVTPSRVRLTVRFLKPFESESDHTLDLAPAGTGTTVTWTMAGSWGWFMSIVTRLFFPIDKTVGADFEKGLAQLKATVEG